MSLLKSCLAIPLGCAAAVIAGFLAFFLVLALFFSACAVSVAQLAPGMPPAIFPSIEFTVGSEAGSTAVGTILRQLKDQNSGLTIMSYTQFDPERREWRVQLGAASDAAGWDEDGLEDALRHTISDLESNGLLLRGAVREIGVRDPKPPTSHQAEAEDPSAPSRPSARRVYR
ncbi:MAG: hypothetical protein JNJ88_15460 [Planctomycetes bacterium]|nr:hypothetical protein [Planctomycetota bacterium]